MRGANHVLKTYFIAAYLTSDPPPDPHTFTPPEVDKLRTRYNSCFLQTSLSVDHANIRSYNNVVNSTCVKKHSDRQYLR